MEDFKHPDIYWMDNAAGHKQTKRSLKCTDDNFLLRKGALLGPIPTNKEGLAKDMKVLAAVTMRWWSSDSRGQGGA